MIWRGSYKYIVHVTERVWRWPVRARRAPAARESAVMLRMRGGCCRKIAAIVTLLVVAQLGFTEVRGDETERLRARVKELEAQLAATEQDRARSCASDAGSSVGSLLASTFGLGASTPPAREKIKLDTTRAKHERAVDVGHHKHPATRKLLETLDPSLARDPQKYLDLARQLMRKQDFEGGVHALKLATHYGCRADIWVHLAKALRSLAGKTYQDAVARGTSASEVSAPTAMPAKYIYQAIASVEVAAQMSNGIRAEAMELRKQLLALVKGTCGASDCERYRRESEAVQLMLSSKYMNATNTLCLDEVAVSISITTDEREEGRIDNMETMRSIWTTYNACGAVVILNAMREETVTKVADAQATSFARDIEPKLHMGGARDSTDTTTIGARNYGRWEIKYPLKSPYIDPDFATNELLLACVKCLMDTRVVEMETFSTVVSLPGSPTMLWHRDDRELWPRALKGEDKHLPVHGTIVYVPLIDLEPAMGSVEFAFGTHVNHEMDVQLMIDDYQHATQNDDPWSPGTDPEAVTPPKGVKPPMPTAVLAPTRGSFIFYDFRTMHRGMKNEWTGQRPISLLSFVRTWWRDGVNFKAQQSSDWDALPSVHMKKVLTRIDAQNYLQNLEDEVAATRGQAFLESIRSDGNYLHNNMFA